jgi:hypothetical protein
MDTHDILNLDEPELSAETREAALDLLWRLQELAAQGVAPAAEILYRALRMIGYALDPPDRPDFCVASDVVGDIVELHDVLDRLGAPRPVRE